MKDMIANQKDMVLHHLLKHGSITSWDAIQLYGITRLSQYIYLLRKEGYVFEKVNIRNAKKGWHYKYILIEG